MKKKVKYENEIDLGEIILILWLNKWKIVLIPFLFMSLTYVFEINKSPFKSLYSSKTEIRPISIFDENEYDLFNAFLKKFDDPEGDIEKRVQFSSFAYINRKYLMQMYLEKLRQNTFHAKAIKEFGLIKKEDYSNNQDYENEARLLASKINLSSHENIVDLWTIELVTHNLSEWLDYLEFIEKKINQEIKLYLNDKLQNLIENEKKLKKYEIEDLEIEIANSEEIYKKNDDTKNPYLKLNKLDIIKKNLASNRNIQRFEEIIFNTPLNNSKNFKAAQMLIDSSIIRKLNEKVSIKKKIILAGFLGLILSMIYSLLLNRIGRKNRK